MFGKRLVGTCGGEKLAETNFYYFCICFIVGGMSLACSGLISAGRLIPDDQKGVPGPAKTKTGRGEIDETNINLHLLPTNTNPQDSFGAHCLDRKDKEGIIIDHTPLLY